MNKFILATSFTSVVDIVNKYKDGILSVHELVYLIESKNPQIAYAIKINKELESFLTLKGIETYTKFTISLKLNIIHSSVVNIKDQVFQTK